MFLGSLPCTRHAGPVHLSEYRLPAGVNHGMAALSGCLEAASHEVDMIHVCEALRPIPTIDEIQGRAFQPDIIGHAVMGQQYVWSVDVAEAPRDEFGISRVNVVAVNSEFVAWERRELATAGGSGFPITYTLD